MAQYRLGILYETGQGVPADRQAAQAWYTLSAHLGNVQAMHNLGVMLSQGIAGAPDFVGAIAWFSSAAEHGVRDSQYNLGVIYARGIGTAPDLITSYKWFALAAAQGDADAAARRDDVAAALSADQLATARASVSAWTPITPIAGANEVAVPAGGWDTPEQRVSVGDRQALVRMIQELLTVRGYDPGPADGMEGPRTRDAVAQFQQSIGLQPNGEPSQAVLDALNATRA
jgi:localization factor PodJL